MGQQDAAPRFGWVGRGPPDLGDVRSAVSGVREAVERVFREEYGRVAALLIGSFGDFEVAEEAIQDALTVALERWPTEGVPPNPAGWIATTAKRRVIDRWRRDRALADKYAAIASDLEHHEEVRTVED